MRGILLCLLLLFSTTIVLAQISKENFAQIDSFVLSEMADYSIPNISIGITSGSKVLYVKDYGANQSEGNYLIGSLSKSFTAIAVLQLADKGKIKLDAPLVKYLPWFRLADSFSSSKITIRHLLNQTGGIPKSAGFTFSGEDSSRLVPQMVSYLSGIQLALHPGTEHIYSNLNYQLLGLLIEKVSGISYSVYLKRYILLPLGMNQTYADCEAISKNGLKKGFQYWFGWTLGVHRNACSKLNLPSGDISSNVKDLTALLQAMLKGTTWDSTFSLLKPASLQLMLTPYKESRYGMGWTIAPLNGQTAIGNTGLSPDFSANMTYLPDRNLGVVILTNVNNFTATRNILDGIMRRINGQEIITYLPFEKYGRWMMLILMLWTIAEFLIRLSVWYRFRWRVKIIGSFKNIVFLLISLTFSLIWLFIVPLSVGIPLKLMIRLQPDFGYGLLITTFVGILSVLVQNLNRSLRKDYFSRFTD